MINSINEQLKVQKHSAKFRSIEDYDLRIAGTGADFRLRTYLDNHTEEKVVRWVDVPAGVGVALQQGVREYGLQIDPVGIDLILWNKKNIPRVDMAELRKKYDTKELEKILRKESFEFIQHDMKTVIISDGADLITAMCGLYYHEDPLGVWLNLFNQLRFDGLLVAHFMFPKKSSSTIDTYRRLADTLRHVAAAEIYFSEDSRDVYEAVLIARKLNHERLFVQAVVKSIETYTVSNGRHGKFQIKVVDYEK